MKKAILTINLWVVLMILALVISAQETFTLPKEENKREADLVELIKLEKTIKLDIRYARSDNFVGRPVYTEARAFLQRPAAEALLQVHKQLKTQGLGLVIFDGYRPWSVTKIFWDVTPEDKKDFVANPKTGSRHNRGCAVDLSLYDLKTGKLIEMPSDFDDFSEKAFPNYTGGTEAQREKRDLLRKMMEAEGFTVNKNEWWHFDYKDWKEYGIYNLSFTAIRNLSLLEGFNVKSVVTVGNTKTRFLTINKRIFLQEGDVFTTEALRKSIDGINRMRKFEKVTEQNVSWVANKADKTVDFTFYLKEK